MRKIPSINNILLLVESQWGPAVAETLRSRIRSGLSWAPESLPGMEPPIREINERWLAQSDLESKPGPIHGPEDIVVRLEPGSKLPF